MALSCGLLGLPNVGKSTLFNTLLGQQAAQAQNYPFCTIEPNKGRLCVWDPRLEQLAEIAQSQKKVPATIDVVDIAGLVKGASQGEGLGNKFLSHVREATALIHVVRCFEDNTITHVNGTVDPASDVEVIQTELILADIESLEKRIPAMEKRLRHHTSVAKGGEQATLEKAQLPLLKRLLEMLHREVMPATQMTNFTPEEAQLMKNLGLLTTKPVLFVLNVSEAALAESETPLETAFHQAFPHAQTLRMCVEAEAGIAMLDAGEQQAFLEDLGLQETGMQRLSRAAFSLLNLETFFTVGPKEAHAWAFPKGCPIPEAAGLIHSDMQRGFIAAEVCGTKHFLEKGSIAKAREGGVVRLEGKTYHVQDGDILDIRFNV